MMIHIPYLSSVIFGLSMLFLLGGCNLSGSTGGDPTTEEPLVRRELPRELSAEEVQIVRGTGTFGVQMIHKLVEAAPDESHFISPLSILMAYGMAMNGAEGDTYAQMQEVFGLEEMSREEINKAALELIELLTEFDDNVRFDIANSIWYRDTFDVYEEFLDTNRHYFQAVIEAADFDDPATVDRINQWVSDNTETRIPEIIDGIDPLAVMFLINAVYFNGDWTVPFDPEDTETRPFYREDGTTTEVEMMHLPEAEEMFYKRGDDYQAVNLWYGDAGFAMTLVLPDEETGLEQWLSRLDWNEWKELTQHFGNVTLTLDLPKFELEYEVDSFKNLLQELGITDAFDPGNSDFSRISSGGDKLYISDTRHKSFIQVDEEGTEAAAVTSIEIRVVSMPRSVTVRFNRPFFYMIREVESGTPLFMGTMTGE